MRFFSHGVSAGAERQAERDGPNHRHDLAEALDCIMGAVLAAVSPAVVVPRMVKLMDEGYGVNEGIPQLILAGASVDDVYVIVLFSTFVGMMQGEESIVEWIGRAHV